MCDTCCSFTLRQSQQAIVTNCTGRRLVNGPAIFNCYCCFFESVKVYNQPNLDPNQYVRIVNELNPHNSRIVMGPKLVTLSDAWEKMGTVESCRTLDQDDYLVIRSENGTKSIIQGPRVYAPSVWAEEILDKAEAVMCPVNHFLIVNDADSTTHPVIHLRGPLKFFPKPFQSLTKHANGMSYHPCIEVTAGRGVHLQRASGQIDLLADPTFYMPQVGERVICEVDRIVMLTNNFCIVKSPNGAISVKYGEDASHRAFFLGPFEQFVKFKVDKGELTVLTTLPVFLSHSVKIRTLDNVTMFLDLRVQYRIFDVPLFSSNPIEFYDYIKYHVQNSLLDKFAQVTLRDFMVSFSKIAEGEKHAVTAYFCNFGIEVDAIQILNYVCPNLKTQELLTMDINTNVIKQNELQARRMDVHIQEQLNEVQRRQKDLEVQLVLKDNEIELERKILENSLRLKELEIEIQEEHKRTHLLEIKRGNDLVEAEFEGRAKGHEFREFIYGIDKNLTHAEKLEVFFRKCELARADVLYQKVSQMDLYPADVEVETHQFGDGTTLEYYSDGMRVSVPNVSSSASSSSSYGMMNSNIGIGVASMVSTGKGGHNKPTNSNLNSSHSGTTSSKATMQAKGEVDRKRTEDLRRKGDDERKAAEEERKRAEQAKKDAEERERIATQKKMEQDFKNRAEEARKEDRLRREKEDAERANSEAAAKKEEETRKRLAAVLQPPPPPATTLSSAAGGAGGASGASAEDLKKAGDLLNTQGKFADAVASYKQALTRPTSDASMKNKILGNMSIAMYSNKQYEESMKTCDEILSTDGKNVKAVVRAMQCANDLGPTKSLTRKAYAAKIVLMGATVVGQKNYDLAIIYLK